MVVNSIEDLFEVGVRIETNEELDSFLQICEAHEITWISLERAMDWTPLLPAVLLISKNPEYIGESKLPGAPYLFVHGGEACNFSDLEFKFTPREMDKSMLSELLGI